MHNNLIILLNYFKDKGFQLNDGDDLFEVGALDSMSFIDLVLFLEHTFDLDIDPSFINVDNFKSINSILLLLK